MTIGKLSTAASATILLCAQQGAQAVEFEMLGRTPPDRGSSCSLLIEFGSVCCGPDQAALEAVTAYLKASPAVRRVRQWSWGKEGEQSLCVTTKDAEAAAALESELKAHLPPRTPQRPAPRFRRDARID